MTNTFKILCRTSNEASWSLYGVFTSEREFRTELSNIRACALQIRRVAG
jgi:hypothetical protein